MRKVPGRLRVDNDCDLVCVPDHPRGRRDARILDEVVQDHQLRMAEEYDAYDRAGRELEVAVSSHADLEARLGEVRAQERLAQWSRGGLHLLADKRFNVRRPCLESGSGS